ncbi:efflux RND transporter periplasmic adaptor subunit [Tautonia sociabilis]|uniref:Efflux RND transporter periplasmic adaptor subunit n=1 Tax=Tautonia sociabilis TaxID=2080755 RepID=A0A432MDV5_9BACT|nr:efflux RND transporter periplasmic adaptor subunit [Tautonia sociabilis]RUL83175.1 efflux RND transporter periplasmic adaptor subunit [Tautonia sociabilis]
MNPFAFARRHPIVTLLLVLVPASGAILALEEVGVDIVPAIDAAGIESVLDRAGSMTIDSLSGMAMAAEPEGQAHQEHQKIVVTRPQVMDVTITEPYVCQIHSQRHIEVCALESGYLQEILINEGQQVKQGDLLFKILPVLYQARLSAEEAEAQLAELEYSYSKQLADQNVVSSNEVKLAEAKLAKAKARVELARAELNFTNVVAPFDGIVDRLHHQLGSLIAEGDMLTTLSDNSVMWVYFNVPEAAYLAYMSNRAKHGDDERIELKLANGELFPHVGTIGAIEAKFNNETGTIPFRADFPNPDRLLRHGQTGTVLISQVLKDVLVIPQRATFELLDKRYVFVIDDKNVAHQRLITVEHEKDDIYIIQDGLDETENIVLEGVRDVRDGETISYEFEDPQTVLSHLKYHAE